MAERYPGPHTVRSGCATHEHSHSINKLPCHGSAHVFTRAVYATVAPGRRKSMLKLHWFRFFFGPVYIMSFPQLVILSYSLTLEHPQNIPEFPPEPKKYQSFIYFALASYQ